MKNQEANHPNSNKGTPFLYRSFFNFWLGVILPASVVTTVLFQIFKSESSWYEFFQLPSTYVKILIFQVIFGAWMYFKEYKPKSKKFKE